MKVDVLVAEIGSTTTVVNAFKNIDSDNPEFWAQGQAPTSVLEGDVKVYTIDYDGNKTIINVIHGRGSVGTMQFMMEYHNVLFEIDADSPSKIIAIDPDTLLIADEQLALIQHKILVNVMASQRQLFISISEHLVCLSQKNIRDKIMRFLKI